MLIQLSVKEKSTDWTGGQKKNVSKDINMERKFHCYWVENVLKLWKNSETEKKEN